MRFPSTRSTVPTCWPSDPLTSMCSRICDLSIIETLLAAVAVPTAKHQQCSVAAEQDNSRGLFLLAQRWGQLLLEQSEEIILIRANLRQHDMVEARVDVFSDDLEMAFSHGAARNLLGHVLRRDMLACRLEPLRVWKLRLHRPSRH